MFGVVTGAVEGDIWCGIVLSECCWEGLTWKDCDDGLYTNDVCVFVW